MDPAIHAHIKIAVKHGKNELGEDDLDEGVLGRGGDDPTGNGRRGEEGDQVDSLARRNAQSIEDNRREGATLLKDQSAVVSALDLTATSNGGRRLRGTNGTIRRSTGTDHRDVNHLGDTATGKDSIGTKGIRGRGTARSSIRRLRNDLEATIRSDGAQGGIQPEVARGLAKTAECDCNRTDETEGRRA